MGCIDNVQDYASSVINFAIAANDKDDVHLSAAKRTESAAIARMELEDVRDYRNAMRTSCPADISAAASALQKPFVAYGVERSRAFSRAGANGSVDEQLSRLPAGSPELATRDIYNALQAVKPADPQGIATMRKVLAPRTPVARLDTIKV